MLIVIAVQVLFGALFCFLGYPFIHRGIILVTSVIVGLAAGSAVSTVIGGSFLINAIITLVTIITATRLTVIIGRKLAGAIRVIGGVLLGAILASNLTVLLSSTTVLGKDYLSSQIIWVLLGAVLGGVLTAFLEAPTLIVLTAMFGGLSIISGYGLQQTGISQIMEFNDQWDQNRIMDFGVMESTRVQYARRFLSVEEQRKIIEQDPEPDTLLIISHFKDDYLSIWLGVVALSIVVQYLINRDKVHAAFAGNPQVVVPAVPYGAGYGIDPNAYPANFGQHYAPPNLAFQQPILAPEVASAPAEFYTPPTVTDVPQAPTPAYTAPVVSSGKQVVVAYRMADAGPDAEQVGDALKQKFGATNVHIGSQNLIEPGEDFVESIKNGIAKSEVLVLVIGRNWLAGDWTADAEDYDSVALAEALKLGKKIVPVLVDSAEMPTLPEHLAALKRRAPARLNSATVLQDIENLVKTL